MNLKISKKNLISLSKIKRPLVFVPMAADILHHGHINILKKSYKLGSVVVGLLTDNGLKSYKGAPIIKYKNRKIILESIKYVNFIIPLNGLYFNDIVKILKPEFFVHGTDWRKGVQSIVRKNLFKIMKKSGGRIIEINYTNDISSTKIKNFIKNK